VINLTVGLVRRTPARAAQDTVAVSER
jgi:hypothetical protein